MFTAVVVYSQVVNCGTA